jgi:3-deoxy-D-manno-octulosonate 8-phosphate phosphatase (KDO 8-P phosphatase)
MSKIKLLILDVDGVLTDCRIWYDSPGKWKRFYSVRDGVGLKELMKIGVRTAVITGSESEEIRERVKALQIEFLYEGAMDKMPSFQDLLEQTELAPEEIAYVGDDIYDIPLLERVGFAATVPEAVDEVKQIAHYVTRRPGGNGAVREVCDLIRKSKSK